MNQQPQKRRNPFEKPISEVVITEEEKISLQNPVQSAPVIEKPAQEPIVEPVIQQQQPIVQPQPVYQPQYQQQFAYEQPYYQPVQQQTRQNKQQKVVKRDTRDYYANQNNDTREKFTSTMEQSLRRRIKIVCAQRGIMFAQFVEDACREKLENEGVK